MTWLERTRSANESSSCPINEDFFLHRATLPSKKSKNSPNGMSANANHRLVRSWGSARQYRIEDRTDMTRIERSGFSQWREASRHTAAEPCDRVSMRPIVLPVFRSPFISVIRSARCNALGTGQSCSRLETWPAIPDHAKVASVLSQQHGLFLLTIVFGVVGGVFWTRAGCASSS